MTFLVVVYMSNTDAIFAPHTVTSIVIVYATFEEHLFLQLDYRIIFYIESL